MTEKLLKFDTGVAEHYHIMWEDHIEGVEICHWDSGWKVHDNWHLIGGTGDDEYLGTFPTLREAARFVKENVEARYDEVEWVRGAGSCAEIEEVLFDETSPS